MTAIRSFKPLSQIFLFCLTIPCGKLTKYFPIKSDFFVCYRCPSFAFCLADVSSFLPSFLPLSLSLFLSFFLSFSWKFVQNNKEGKTELSGKEGIRRLSGQEINVVFPRASWAKHRNADKWLCLSERDSGCVYTTLSQLETLAWFFIFHILKQLLWQIFPLNWPLL